jgi:hypothetical protein
MGAVPFEKRNDDHAQNIQIRALVVRQFGHVGSQRADQAIAEQNAEKRSDQCCRDFSPNLLGRATERFHGYNHAQHRRTMPRPGSESATVVSEATGWVAS